VGTAVGAASEAASVVAGAAGVVAAGAVGARIGPRSGSALALTAHSSVASPAAANPRAITLAAVQIITIAARPEYSRRETRLEEQPGSRHVEPTDRQCSVKTWSPPSEEVRVPVCSWRSSSMKTGGEAEKLCPSDTECSRKSREGAPSSSKKCRMAPETSWLSTGRSTENLGTEKCSN